MEENSTEIRYFAYGSNLDVAQMRERCPQSELLERAFLPQYSLAFGGHSKKRGGGVATIIPHENGNRVEGVMYQLTKKDLAKLDKFEGFPRQYNRMEVSVEDGAGNQHKVITYYLNEYYPNPPSTTYYGIIRTGYSIHGLDPDGLYNALQHSRNQNS